MKQTLRLSLLLLTISLGCCLPKSWCDAKEQVILVHGYGRSARAMNSMKRRFMAEGYLVHTMNYSSLTQSIEGIEDEVNQGIDQVLQAYPYRTHFVGHSLGGLLVRAYLGKRKPDRLGRVVLLGSPNQGTPAVDHLARKWWFGLIGSAAQSLSSSGSVFLSSLPQPTYPLGVIAGLSQRSFIRGAVFTGKHDGLVPLESTKVKGMQDFCVVRVNHTALRYHQPVFNHTVHFLKHGSFECPEARDY